MESNNEIIWRLNNNDKWVLYSNNHIQLTPLIQQDKLTNSNDKPKSKKEKKESNSAFYFAKVKSETKGTLVFTPKGYGIVQNLKSDQNMITVKVNNEILDFTRQQVANEIIISLCFVTNSGRREDKIILPIHSTAKDLIEKIEAEQDSEKCMGNRIFFQGKELNKTNETLEKMGIVPFSKLLIIAALGKPLTVNRFPTNYQGWGFSETSIDAISFSPSRDVRVIGFGIYTPENDTLVEGIAKFIQGNDVKGLILFAKDVRLSKNTENSEDKIYKFMLNRPVRVKAGEQYSCSVEFKKGSTYYGSGGVATPSGEQDVIFTFTDCIGSSNGTGVGSGQIPEVYYYV